MAGLILAYALTVRGEEIVVSQPSTVNVPSAVVIRNIEDYIKEKNVRGLYETAKCESNFRETAVGDGGLAYGVMQFHEATFNWFKKLSGMTELEYRNSYDQVDLAVWAFQNNLNSHWSCWRKLVK